MVCICKRGIFNDGTSTVSTPYSNLLVAISLITHTLHPILHERKDQMEMIIHKNRDLEQLTTTVYNFLRRV